MVPATVVALFASGCAVTRKRVVVPAKARPALEATKAELLEKYNQQARAIKSVNASVELIPTAGSAYSGVIEEYHDVSGFILARKPAHIRVIGQAPVVLKDIFDMVSDGESFRIYIPSKRKFIVGPTNVERAARKPIENLRPQHLLDGLFWPVIPEGAPVLFEEWNDANERDYILTLPRETPKGWEIARKIWFDRTDLHVARVQIYGPAGQLLSDIRYADWEPAGGARYPRHLWVTRPHDDYQLEVRIIKVSLNEPIAEGRFRLEQPAGTELVRTGEGVADTRP